MVTVVTHVPLKEGAEGEWDTVMRARRELEGLTDGPTEPGRHEVVFASAARTSESLPAAAGI